jgi:hypothetical protein
MADWVDEETDNVRTTEKWTRDGTKVEFVRLNVSVIVAIGSTYYAAGCIQWPLVNSSGSFAMLAAMRRASSASPPRRTA